MKLPELIKSFEDQEVLPIDVNDILLKLREAGNDDDIEFVGVDLDPEVLLGAIRIFYVRNGVYADPKRFVNIYYDRTRTVDWQRMVCCKELVHILDPETAHTKLAAEIDLLAERIGLPPEMQDPAADGFATNIDRMAEYRAAALLLPMAARELLMPKIRDGSLKIADVAKLADMPTKYAGFVLNDVWETVYPLLTR